MLSLRVSPARLYSPNETLALVSTEISRASGPLAAFSWALRTLAKMASVSFNFFSGLVFWMRRRR